jgi:hypothetical protein
MPYRDRTADRFGQLRRAATKMLVSLQFGRRRRYAQLDLMTLNPHLRRDLGLSDSELSKLIDR